MSSAISDDVPSTDRIGELISGRYRICSRIGEGGMGAVYLAEHTLMKKRFAVKLLHPEMAKRDEVLARFRREAEAAAHVEHPNIVAATDFGQTDDGAFFLVLEYVDGVSLRRRLADGPLETARALHIGRQIALALECAHEAGIVHRDLKPENVMLVAKDGDPDFVKVLDFGVARFDRPSDATAELLTQAGTVMGSPSYMAPEQAVGDRVNHRADLYAVGCVLYEMLTGRCPFEGDLMELLSKHLTAPVPPMMERAVGVVVPTPIETMVRKLLEKDANARYPNARALVEAIDRAAMESGIDAGALGPTSGAISVPSARVIGSEGEDVVNAKTVMAAGAQTAAPMSVWNRCAPYLEKASGAAAPLVARADDLIGSLSARLNLPRRVLVGAAAGAMVLGIVLVVALAARGEPSTTSDGGVVTKILGSAPGASAEEIRSAAAKGPAALEQLAATFPKDPAVQRELAFAYDAAGRGSDALRVVRLMAEGDASGVPRDLVRVVIRGASKTETADEAFGMLEGTLGTGGVDALLELAVSKDVPMWTSARAQKSMTKPSVRANASPGTRFFLDLVNASTCDERHDVLRSAGDQADGRALPVLRALESKSGCGRRRRFDCHPCLRKDDALGRAIEAAEARGS
jgi:eukaryotic-like serine/threonine-protein kinase